MSSGLKRAYCRFAENSEFFGFGILEFQALAEQNFIALFCFAPFVGIAAARLVFFAV